MDQFYVDRAQTSSVWSQDCSVMGKEGNSGFVVETNNQQRIQNFLIANDARQ